MKISNIKIKTVDLLILFPFLIILGKIVRWTIMVGTLVNMSKGWGYIDDILTGGWQVQLFGWDEIMEAGSDAAGNAIAVFKIVRKLFFDIPQDFYDFEIAITIVWGVMTFYVLTKLKEIIPLIEAIYIVLAVIVLSVYDFSLGKEPVQMLYFILLFIVLISNKLSEKQKWIWSIGVLLIAVVTYRVYFVIIFAFGAVVWLVMEADKRKNYKINSFEQSKKRQLLSWGKIIQLYLILIGTYTMILLALRVVNGSLFQKFIDSLLLASPETRSGNTYIENLIATEETTNPFIVSIEYALVTLRMMVPFELFSLGPKYWPYILYQLCMAVILIRALRRYRINSPEQNIAVLIWIGFWFMSGIFEVDFGAWVRHASVSVPLILILGDMTHINYRRKVKEK